MAAEQYRPSGFKLLPDVVKNLLIINGLFFFATIVPEQRGVNLIDILGLHYFGSEKFHPYQLITYMFMHGGFWHIALNMFALWMFGAAVENIWGPRKFLVYYLFCGIGAAITHYAVLYFQLSPDINEINNFIASHTLSSGELSQVYQQRTDLLNAPIVVGASGAIFGLLLAYGMIFPNSIIYLYLAIPIKAKYFVILYGLMELFSGVAGGANDNVAHFAHLGGLLFGFILIMFWRYQNHRRNKYFK